jgi:hypothetical protein
MTIRAFVFGLLALSASIATAADAGSAISGAGVVTCKKWEEGRALKTPMIDNVFGSWTQGFFSALNAVRLRAGDKAVPTIPKMSELLALIDTGCSTEPDLPVYDVAIKAYGQLPNTAVGSN